jgi:phage baseplate assembly protein W
MAAGGNGNGVRPHLGVGWPFPVRPQAGAISFLGYEDKVEEAIGIVLETAQRERVMLPAFGAGLRNYVFESNSPLTRGAIESAVRKALTDWEPRISVEGVRARSSSDTPNLIQIEIDYVVKRTNTFYNRVFPFFLTQPQQGT